MFSRQSVVCALLAIVVGSDSRTHNLFQHKVNKPLAGNNLDSENDAASKSSAPQSVNERFPTAVLFGGACGGTILSDKWVLTAGHCTIFTSGSYVLADTSNMRDGSGVRVYVKKLYLHPLFTVGPYFLNAERFNITQVQAHWDFLLAELEEPLPLNNKTIKAALLDPPNTLDGGLAVGFAGYGATSQGGSMRSSMRAMNLTTLSDEDCSSLPQYDKRDMLCARTVAPQFDSACNGDSGSGLVDELNVVVGVLSWGERDAIDCSFDAKVVFAKVSAARSWIREITGI